mgnify:CR=1 FL=1
MKRITTVICMALLWILTVQAQIQELNVSKRFNWGIRLGVNAPLVDIRHLTLNGNKVDESDSESSLGLSGSFIGRYNFKKHYIQLEVGMHQFHIPTTGYAKSIHRPMPSMFPYYTAITSPNTALTS